MHILFLNQYFPPDPAPTGVLLQELASALTADGHEVEFVSAGQEYRGGQQRGGRMRRELSALGRMLAAGLRAQRPDLVISASSPPMLAVAATAIAARHRARSIHWIMDLYPELAVALGEVPGGVLAKGLTGMMRLCYRRTDRVVVLDEDMAARLRSYGVEPAIIRPWVFERLAEQSHEPAEADEPWTWIYSGNLGRAHEWETLLRVQAEVERRGSDIRLLFQGGGPSWEAAQTRAGELGLRRCDWKPYVSEEELRAALLRCHCCTVTQRPAAQGLLWPSKLGLLLTLPRPLLWIGPTDGAIARELRSVSHAGVFAPGAVGEIADWLIKQRGRPAVIDPAHLLNAADHRQSSLATWRSLIREVLGAGEG